MRKCNCNSLKEKFLTEHLETEIAITVLTSLGLTHIFIIIIVEL